MQQISGCDRAGRECKVPIVDIGYSLVLGYIWRRGCVTVNSFGSLSVRSISQGINEIEFYLPGID